METQQQRNMIIAVLLSVMVFIGWTALSEIYFPPPKSAAPKTTPAAAAPGKAGALPTPAATALIKTEAAIAAAPRVTIETPRLVGSISLRGARIDDLVLPTYRETVSKSSPPVRLLSPAGTAKSYFAGFGWSGDGVALPNEATLWQADAAKLTPATPVTLSWTNASGQTFRIKFSVDANYMFAVEQSITNAGTAPLTVRAYSFVNRAKPIVTGGTYLAPSREADSWTIHIGPIGVFNGAANYDIDYTDLEDPAQSPPRLTSEGGWIGFGDSYWLTAQIPAQNAKVDTGFQKGNGIFQADYALPPATIAPGATVATKSHFFAGAKEVATLDTYETSLGIIQFGKAIDWGWFEIIEKPIFYLLDWLFRAIGNFGVAIMCLTVIVRGLLFPLAQRQFASMAAMRVVQPKMKALQERYKDDKPGLQQAMIELYKTEKINPMAGCLPIFLQIPIMFALYKVLMLTIEMRHQPFVLWIRDLSAHDPANLVALAGLASIPLPEFFGIGVLALLLGVTMWLQFKLNPAPVDPAQQQIFAIMPWLMMFMMAPFAAGLLLYWTTSNVLTIAQQRWLYSRHPALKEPIKT